MRGALCGGLLWLSLGLGSAAAATLTIPDSELEPLRWTDLAAWGEDDHKTAFATFRAGCKAVVRSRRPAPAGQALKKICGRALVAGRLGDRPAREFFERHFVPVRVSKLGDAQGFLTGYYEPVVEGSRTASAEYAVPMHKRPRDLVAIGQRAKTGGFPNSGPVGRRVGKDKYVPYHDRAEIEDGALSGKKLEICYLKDPIEAFFVHIQGSARVRLKEGGTLRLNYDAHNGHTYTPVGRILIERNIVPREEMSMERIRQFMLTNPEEGRDLRRRNRSYVFFRDAKLSEHHEALGAQGLPLTAGRSIAVDKKLHTYGIPFWIEAELPLAAENVMTPFRRLMIAQDTGSAIVGPARGDLYFGAGREAGLTAGRIRHPGRFVMLVPRPLDPAAAARRMPLPRPKPNPDVLREEPKPAAAPGSRT